MKAYSVAGLTTAGPWIVMTITMGILQWIINQFSSITTEEREIFIFSVSYCFIFSQLIFSTQQYTATRYLSDLLYSKKEENVFPLFIGVTKVVSVLALLLWIVFYAISPLPFLYKLILLFLFLTTNLIWIILLFLSATKNFKLIAWAFLIGGVTSLLATLLICLNENLFTANVSFSLVLLSSFTFGMILTLFLLMLTLLKTFPEWSSKGQFDYLSYFERFPSLFFIGVFYNLGIWACNWVIWFGEGAKIVAGSFIVHPIYDMALFWSYLTILPTMVLIVISIETRFYRKYKLFFNYVNKGGTLAQIRTAKKKMFNVLFQEIQKVLRSQLIITLIVVMTAGPIFRMLSFDEKFIHIFRITAFGAFANGMLLVILLLLLYFEDRKGALYSSFVFFSLNLAGTVILLPGGYQYYGLSFAFGAIVSFVFAIVRLLSYLNSIEYHAFCGQGIQIKTTLNRFHRFGKWLEKNQFI